MLLIALLPRLLHASDQTFCYGESGMKTFDVFAEHWRTYKYCSGHKSPCLNRIHNALLLKGEEKPSEKDINVAESELINKMTSTWCPGVFGECCFQLAYAAGGGLLRYYAIK